MLFPGSSYGIGAILILVSLLEWKGVSFGINLLTVSLSQHKSL